MHNAIVHSGVYADVTRPYYVLLIEHSQNLTNANSMLMSAKIVAVLRQWVVPAETETEVDTIAGIVVVVRIPAET